MQPTAPTTPSPIQNPTIPTIAPTRDPSTDPSAAPSRFFYPSKKITIDHDDDIDRDVIDTEESSSDENDHDFTVTVSDSNANPNQADTSDWLRFDLFLLIFMVSVVVCCISTLCIVRIWRRNRKATMAQAEIEKNIEMGKMDSEVVDDKNKADIASDENQIINVFLSNMQVVPGEQGRIDDESQLQDRDADPGDEMDGEYEDDYVGSEARKQSIASSEEPGDDDSALSRMYHESGF